MGAPVESAPTARTASDRHRAGSPRPPVPGQQKAALQRTPSNAYRWPPSTDQAFNPGPRTRSRDPQGQGSTPKATPRAAGSGQGSQAGPEQSGPFSGTVHDHACDSSQSMTRSLSAPAPMRQVTTEAVPVCLAPTPRAQKPPMPEQAVPGRSPPTPMQKQRRCQGAAEQMPRRSPSTPPAAQAGDAENLVRGPPLQRKPPARQASKPGPRLPPTYFSPTSSGTSSASNSHKVTRAGMQKYEFRFEPKQQQEESLEPQYELVARTGKPGDKESRIPSPMLEFLYDTLQPPQQPRSFPAEGEFPCIPGNAEAKGDVEHEEIVLERPIGEGSFGAVWRGTCHGEVMAIKQCKVDEAKEGDIAMLLKEIRYLQTLRHHRLVSYLGCCNSPPHVILLMEYMPRGSLHHLLFGSKKKDLAFGFKARIGMQVSEGLTYIHELFVVHRDLKPSNIVLDKDYNAKICDFGLTITLEKTHMTVKALQGSPRYMAPEQFEANAKVTEKVDIWQMGCVMLELFCLLQPFHTACNIQQIARQLLIKKMPPPLPADMDLRARILIQSCVRIDAKLRPDAEHLTQALAYLFNLYKSDAASP